MCYIMDLVPCIFFAVMVSVSCYWTGCQDYQVGRSTTLAPLCMYVFRYSLHCLLYALNSTSVTCSESHEI